MSRIIFKVNNDAVEILDSDFDEPYFEVRERDGEQVILLSLTLRDDTIIDDPAAYGVEE